MTPLPLIPDHTLLRPIGRGAYGEVWLARNIMGALRAVKVVQRGQFESERPYEREFDGIQRYEPVSRSSNGLVHLLHVGRNEGAGYFYYVMELADNALILAGHKSTEPIRQRQSRRVLRPEVQPDPTQPSYVPRTLREDLRRLGRLPTADCLRLALDVVSGLAQLHRHQLVHRDVKPGNIIFVEGHAKLADIGLVSSREEGRTFVGTEGYIPPEGPGSAGADLYALGVVLYEASTGNRPEQFPDIPTEWLSDPAGDEALEFHEVILKACESQRERRYQTADEMQADLALLQSGQSVRQTRTLERRYARLRMVGVLGTILLAGALLVAGLARYRERVAATIQARETALRQQAQQSLTRAEAAEHDAREQLYTALLEQAKATTRSGELGQRVRALNAVQRAAALSNTVELRREAFAALALPDLQLEREITFTQDEGGRACDPSFRRFAVCPGRGSVEIRAVADNQLLATLPPAVDGIGYVKYWNDDGRYLAVKRDVDQDSADLEVWDLTSTQRVLFARNSVTDQALSFHPRLPQLAAADQEGVLTVWDLVSGHEIRKFKLPGWPFWLAFAPDGERIAVSYQQGASNAIAVVNADTGKARSTFSIPHQAFCVAWQPQGRWLAFPDLGGNVRVLDPATGETLVLGQHKAQAVSVMFSPDGTFLLSGSWERELVCWDMRTMRRAFNIGLASDRAQFSRDGRYCAVHTTDRLQIYQFQAPTACRELAGDLGQGVLFGQFSPDGQWLAAGGTKAMGVWGLKAKTSAQTLPREGVTLPLFAPGTSELYVYAAGSLGRWRLAPTEGEAPPELRKLPLWLPAEVRAACIASNELIVIGAGGIWSTPLGHPQFESARHWKIEADIGAASLNGQWLALAPRWTPVLPVFRWPGLEPVVNLTNRAFVCGFAFSPGHDELAVVTERGVEFYDTVQWQRHRELTVHCEGFSRVHFSPDGKTFWLNSHSRNSALYDTHTLAVLLPLPSGTLPLAVSPDGRHLAVSVDLRRAQIWDLADLRRSLRELRLDW